MAALADAAAPLGPVVPLCVARETSLMRGDQVHGVSSLAEEVRILRTQGEWPTTPTALLTFRSTLRFGTESERKILAYHLEFFRVKTTQTFGVDSLLASFQLLAVPRRLEDEMRTTCPAPYVDWSLCWRVAQC